MKTKQLVLTALLLAFFIDMNAQFVIDAQYRIRGQVLHGYKTPISEDAEASYHVGQRTRLNLRYNEAKFSTLLSVQDVRVWGDADIVNGTGVVGKSYNNMDIYEAWVNYKFNEKSTIKIGRQEMIYDDQRHISWRNWWNNGMTYDAVTFSHNNKESGWRLDLSASYNSTSESLVGNDFSQGTDYFGSVNPIQTHNFIYLKKSFSEKTYLSLTAITAGYRSEDNSNTLYMTNTEGLHFNYNATKKSTDGLFGIANVFIQNGKNISGKKIDASMITAQLGYRTMGKKLELYTKIERLSGHDATNSDVDYNNTVHTYNLLNGARHPYYEGFLDWFVVPGSSGNGGLLNAALGLKYNASAKDIIWFEYCNVSSVENAKSIVNSNPVIIDQGNLVNTFDFTYIRKVSKNIKWMNGFSYGIPSDEFNDLKGIQNGGTNFSFYTMITFTPKFFDSSKK